MSIGRTRGLQAGTQFDRGNSEHQAPLGTILSPSEDREFAGRARGWQVGFSPRDSGPVWTISLRTRSHIAFPKVLKTDTFTPEKRCSVMRAIKGKNTKPEMII